MLIISTTSLGLFWGVAWNVLEWLGSRWLMGDDGIPRSTPLPLPAAMQPQVAGAER